MSDYIARHVLAAELGVQTQTIAKWERDGWFPEPEQRISDRLILYRRTASDRSMVGMKHPHPFINGQGPLRVPVPAEIGAVRR